MMACIPFWDTFTLTSDLIFKGFHVWSISPISYITNNFPQMHHMLDIYLWGTFVTLLRHVLFVLKFQIVLGYA